MEIKTIKFKDRAYEVFCRNCDFIRSGHNSNILRNARDHAKIRGHSVDVYTESVKLLRPERRVINGRKN